MKKSLILAFSVAALFGCGPSGTPPQEVSAQPEAAKSAQVQSVPSHHYALQDGLEYGYEEAVSAAAQNQGQVASKLLMFKYLGMRDGVLQFHAKNGEFHIVFQCELPCDFVKQTVFYGMKPQNTEHIRAVEGSIVWALTRDAMNGFLKKYEKERNGKMQEIWFDESGPKWRPV